MRKLVTKSTASGIGIVVALLLSMTAAKAAQPYLSHLHATKDSPLYTTYAAAMQRSEFTLDIGYHMVFYDSSRGVEFQNQKGGDWGVGFVDLGNRPNNDYICRLSDLFHQPVITTSYSDIVRYHYYPLNGIRVDVTFFVYSSHSAVQTIRVTNASGREREIGIAPYLRIDKGTFHSVRELDRGRAVTFSYIDLPDEWMVSHDMPHVDTVANLFKPNFSPDSVVVSSASFPWLDMNADGDSARSIAYFKHVSLPPKGTFSFRVVRTVSRSMSGIAKMLSASSPIMRLNINPFIKADEKLYRRIPQIHFSNPDSGMMYWSAFNLLRQCMLPPEGKCHYNYYVFSREPVWGWGHGGQVFHESLSMLAYVFLDPQSAMNSQKVFMERQHADGYINYRTGPYLDETIPYKGQLTTSAPWFNWENWEIFKATRDRKFLKKAYASGTKFFEYWERNRNSEHDGLFEWGGEAVLESVRDDQVAVWDKVGWPSNFEGPDLNSMLVVEAKSLSKMAEALGKNKEAAQWKCKADRIAELINKYMWDDSTGFYYNVNKINHTFTFKHHNDLKRKEIIGFLPLWAGVATTEQAAMLVKTLTDTSEFWRKFGIPSLAADDSYYNPKGYWNGPVWVEWNYLIEHGLLKYGYRKLARELVGKVVTNVIAQLKKDHYFWEFYDPDARWAGYHRSYIWAGLVSRMLMDVMK